MDRQIIASIEDHEQVVANLNAALKFASNLAGAYCHASDNVRRQMNQVLFHKIYVDRHGICGIELTELFQLLLHPKVLRAAHSYRVQKAKTSETFDREDCLDQLFRDLVQPLEAGLDASATRNEQTTDLIKVGGLSNDHLVGVEV